MAKKVFIGLSGGVDSSVSAVLLKKSGHDVTGVFIKTWTPDWLQCTWKEERLDAMRVCAKLDIPFITLDLEKEYKRDVVDYMIAEYKAGKTPNPDVMCNRYVKFGGFFDWAMKQGADYVATGHYARVASDATREARNPKSEIRNKSQIPNLKPQTTNYKLLTGSDQNKDQSYFLWQIRQEQLPHILFPVGGMLKPEVRKLANKFGLPTADKKDSQGLCFMGKIDVKDFLAHYIKSKHGKVLNEKGEEIGWHDGAIFLTIGERHGFTIIKKTNNDKPFFVVSKNINKNIIVVANRTPDGTLPTATKEILVSNINFITPISNLGEDLKARARYRQPLQKVRIINDELGIRNREMKIEFDEPQTVASGQSVVFYSGDVCLGGGIVV